MLQKLLLCPGNPAHRVLGTVHVRFASKLFQPEKPKSTVKLLEPLGQAEKPLISDNEGEEGFNLVKKWKELTDPGKNRQRRDEIKKEFAQTTFAPIYDYRNTGGKFFTSPPAPFKEQASLYFPTIHGLAITGTYKNTTQLLRCHNTIIRIFSTELAKKQVSSFTENIDLKEYGWALVDVNLQLKRINHFLVKLFKGRIKREIEGDHHTYMISRNGVTRELLHSLKADNPFGGYLYVVDRYGKIRWAGSGYASEDERRVLQKMLSRGFNW